MRIRRALLALCLACGVAATTPATADTPKNMVVMAAMLDEFISLDPAEIYELVPIEYAANVYDRLVRTDPRRPGEILPGLAERWSVADDGRTFTFTLRRGARFHSGREVSAADAAWSLARLVRLNKGPAFLLTQMGFSADNVAERIRAVDATTLVLVTGERYAPTFVLNCLGAWAASVLDRELLLANEMNGDLGNAWLKTREAGSGPFRLVALRPGEALTLEAFPGHWQDHPAMRRVVLRHVPEAAAQRLLLEKGDVDIARNLGPDDLAALRANPDVRVRTVPAADLLYLGLNTRHPAFAKPAVREALKWLVDYEGISRHVFRETHVPHQTFLPAGFFGAIDDLPYRFDPPRAKALLAAAGYPDGFSATIDVRKGYPGQDLAQILQANFAQAGVRLELLVADNKQTLTRYRARQHDIYQGYWAPDYIDPHSNAQGFAWNPDNGDASPNRLLAWRNAWDIPDYTRRTEAALAEPDPARRRAAYEALQRDFARDAPFVILFQKVLTLAERRGVEGFVTGPINDQFFYSEIVKR